MKTFLRSFIRRKNFKIYLLVLTILFSFIMTILSINEGLKSFIEEKNNTEVNRTIVVTTKDDEQTFKEKTKHIPIDKINSFTIPVIGVLNDNIINIQECNIDDQQILLPKQYVSLVGFSTSIIYQDETYKYLVKNIHEKDYACLSNNELNKLISQIEKTYIIIIDQQINVEKTTNELKKLNYDVNIDLTKQNQAGIFNNIKTALSITILILIVCLFGLFHFIFTDMLQEERHTIAILKSVGYNNKKVLLVMTMKFLFLIMCITLLSIISSFIIVLIIDYLINLKYKIKLSLTILTLAKSLFVLLITFTLANLINMQRIRKVLPIEMFKGE